MESEREREILPGPCQQTKGRPRRCGYPGSHRGTEVLCLRQLLEDGARLGHLYHLLSEREAGDKHRHFKLGFPCRTELRFRDNFMEPCWNPDVTPIQSYWVYSSNVIFDLRNVSYYLYNIAIWLISRLLSIYRSIYLSTYLSIYLAIYLSS